MKFSHINKQGKAKMVDVGNKTSQRRMARAAGTINLSPDTIQLIQQNQIKKGDVLTVAKIAGMQAAKRTHDLIPLCHPLLLDNIDILLSTTKTGVDVITTIKCVGKTGVEMEALTAVSVALLTIYDMCKAVDKNMQIGAIKLVQKEKQDV